MRKPFFKSIGFHSILILGAILFFIFKNANPPKADFPIELQLADIHIHHEDPKLPSQQKISSLSTKTSDPAPVDDAMGKAESTPPSQTSAAANSSSSWSNFSDEEKMKYLATLTQIISAHRYYPKSAILNEEQGVVQIKVSLASDGKILNCELAKSSKYPSLDQAAIKTLTQIGSLPLPPKHEGALTLLVPIRYEINPRD